MSEFQKRVLFLLTDIRSRLNDRELVVDRAVGSSVIQLSSINELVNFEDELRSQPAKQHELVNIHMFNLAMFFHSELNCPVSSKTMLNMSVVFDP